MKKHALAIFRAALAAADPTAAVTEALKSRKDLDRYRRIFVDDGTPDMSIKFLVDEQSRQD